MHFISQQIKRNPDFAPFMVLLIIDLNTFSIRQIQSPAVVADIKMPKNMPL